MDNAVALVQAYLRINGYFTVTEFPVIEAGRSGQHRTATDIDVLAFRFQNAARLVPHHGRSSSRDVTVTDIDPALGLRDGEADMLVGEVKEGKAVLNRGATQPAVLRAALTRFGCCDHSHAERLATELTKYGATKTEHGHRIRLAAFGSTRGEGGAQTCHVVLLSQVIDHLERYIERHWDTLRLAEFKEPGLAFMGVLKKAGLVTQSRSHH